MFSSIIVTDEAIQLKFEASPKAASLTNDKFRVMTTAATPAEVTGALDSINIDNDWNGIRRTLILHFNNLEAGTYNLVVNGIVDSAGRPLGSYSYEFTIVDDVSEGGESPDPDPGDDDDIIPGPQVEDHSIIPDAFSTIDTIPIGVGGTGTGFHLVKADPDPNDLFVDSEYNNGRIALTFSQRPATQFLTNEYFKVQRKQIGEYNRWQRLPIKIGLDSSRPKVYLYIPSTDATPVYNTQGHEYFESGTKYQVKISREVAASG